MKLKTLFYTAIAIFVTLLLLNSFCNLTFLLLWWNTLDPHTQPPLLEELGVTVAGALSFIGLFYAIATAIVAFTAPLWLPQTKTDTMPD